MLGVIISTTMENAHVLPTEIEIPRVGLGYKNRQHHDVSVRSDFIKTGGMIYLFFETH